MNTFINYNKLTGVSINSYRNTGLCVGEDIEDIIFAVHYEQEGELTCSLDLQQALDFLCDAEAMEKLGITDDMQDAVELVYNIIQENL